MKKRFLLLLAGLFITATWLCGQTPEFPAVETLTPETIYQTTIEPMYTCLIILFGYLSGFIPGVNKFKPFLRVVAFGLVTGLGFTLFGGASIWKLAFSYLLSSGLYITFFKNILPSPKPATV